MDKEAPTIDENLEAADTETTDDPSLIEGSTSLKQLDQRLSALQDLFDKQITRNQNQKQMFDTIYGEMKDYKENVLLEAFHRPIIQNLIQLYDRFEPVTNELKRITKTLESSEKSKLKEELSKLEKQLENLHFELEEVLYRMDVIPYEEHPIKLDRKLHRTLDTVSTDNPDKDEEVKSIEKIGFYWREKVFRPEEVTIFRYIQPAGEKGDETDG